MKVARGRSTQECFQGLSEACGNAALPYRTVARWIKAFREVREAVQDNLRDDRKNVSGDMVRKQIKYDWLRGA